MSTSEESGIRSVTHPALSLLHTSALCNGLSAEEIERVAMLLGPVQAVMGEDNPYANWATVLLIVVLAYYVTLSVPLTVGMALFTLFCLFITQWIVAAGMSLWAVSLFVFVVAWIGQFYGHKVEGKKPSFLKDLQFLLIGPAWLMHFLFKRLGIPF